VIGVGNETANQMHITFQLVANLTVSQTSRGVARNVIVVVG